MRTTINCFPLLPSLAYYEVLLGIKILRPNGELNYQEEEKLFLMYFSTAKGMFEREKEFLSSLDENT